jgi:hypothetical protein
MQTQQGGEPQMTQQITQGLGGVTLAVIVAAAALLRLPLLGGALIMPAGGSVFVARANRKE